MPGPVAWPERDDRVRLVAGAVLGVLVLGAVVAAALVASA